MKMTAIELNGAVANARIFRSGDRLIAECTRHDSAQRWAYKADLGEDDAIDLLVIALVIELEHGRGSGKAETVVPCETRWLKEQLDNFADATVEV